MKMRMIFLLLLGVISCCSVLAQQETSRINWFVGNTEPGEWIEYKQVWLSAGDYRFTGQVQGELEGQQVQLEINGVAVKGNVDVPESDTFTLVHLGTKSLEEGRYDIRLKFVTGNVNCDMFFIKKSSNTSADVLPTDIEYTASPLDDGMMVVPIGDQSQASGEMINVGNNQIPYRDKNGALFSEEQVLAWYKQLTNTYTPPHSDQAFDMWVAELVAAKPDFVLMHGRSATDFDNEIEDRDYQFGVGELSGRLLKRFVEAVERSPYANGNIKLAYFQDNASYAKAYNIITGKTMQGWDDPDWLDWTWKHWFTPWFDNVPREMLFMPEEGKVPIQLWTANIKDYDNTGSDEHIVEFLNYIEERLKSTYDLEPLWILRDHFWHRDPRTQARSWGYGSWFKWDGDCTSITTFNNEKWAFAVNGKRYGLPNCFLNDWDPETGVGTVPSDGSDTDYFTSSLLTDGTPLIEEAFEVYRDAGAKMMTLESWSDWKEGTVWYRSDHSEWLYPNQHLNLVREYADRSTESIVLEAEACDFFYDKSYKNAGGEYRYHWHTDGIPGLDIYRPMHMLSDPIIHSASGEKFRQLTAGFYDLWAVTEAGNIKSTEIDGSPFGWESVNHQMDLKDLSIGRFFVWGIDQAGKAYMATLKNGHDHFQIKDRWEDKSGGMVMHDLDLNWKEVWAVNKDGFVFRRDLDGKKHWELREGVKLISITADESFVWGFDQDGRLRNTIGLNKSVWNVIDNPHNVTHIEAEGGELWGTNELGELYRTSSSGTSSWELVAENVNKFSVGWEYAWVIYNDGVVHQFELYGFDDQHTYNTTQFSNDLKHYIPGIIQAQDYRNGGEGLAYHDVDDLNIGGQSRIYEGVDVFKTTDTKGKFHIGSIQSDEWIEYAIAGVVAGTYDISLRVASEKEVKNAIHIIYDGELLAEMDVPSTGGGDMWQTLRIDSIDFKAASDKILRLEFRGGGFALNHVSIANGQKPYKQHSLPGKFHAEDYDLGGLGSAYMDIDDVNEAGYYRPDEGVDIGRIEDEDEAYFVGWTNDGEWTEYTMMNIAEGTYALTVRVGTLSDGRWMEIFLDDEVIQRIDIESTGGYRVFKEVRVEGIKLAGGENQVVKIATSGGLNIDYLDFELMVGINEIPAFVEEFNYYPNPVREDLNIDFTLEKTTNVSIDIVGLNGLIFKQAIAGKYLARGRHCFQIPMTNLMPGVYIVKVIMDNHAFARKIVVQ